MNREEVVHWFPTYEVDDVSNEFGGSIERLGVMGDLFVCPGYPRASKKGWYRSFEEWMNDLADGKYLSHDECEKAIRAKATYESNFYNYDSADRAVNRALITDLCAAICRLDWDKVHSLLK